MKQSLEKRIILFSFIILSMTILANTAMEIAVFRKEYVQEILLRSQSTGTALKSSIEKVLALGIDIRDITGLAEKCRDTVQTDPEMSYCIITDNEGKILFSSDSGKPLFDFSRPQNQKPFGESGQRNVMIIDSPRGKFYDTRIPIASFDSKVHATIHIGFPQKAVDSKVYAIILRSILIFAVFFVISFALVILFLKRSIIAPIAKLLEGVTRIARGEFRSTIPPLPVYELDQLATNINSMSQALETRDQELNRNYTELSATHTQLHESYLKLEKMSRDLEHSEELYKKLQEEAGDSIIILDDSEKVIIANKMAEAFFGYPAAEMVGQHISGLLIMLGADNIPHHLKLFKEAYEGNPVDSELNFSNSRHEQLFGRVHASCVTMEDQSLLQIIIRDITKEREILLNLENSAAGLARLNRMKDSFLGMASHELKTPLTVIMGYSELLLTDMKDQLNDASSEMIQNISGAASRLDNIIRDMIDVSMIDQKQLKLKLVPLDINALVESTVSELRFFLALRKQRILTNLERSLPVIHGDQTRLIQMLSNILVNAIKFTPDGGCITVTTTLRIKETSRPLPGLDDSKRLNISSGQQQYIEIVITDTGIGIDTDDQRRIFDKFYEVGSIEEHSSGRVAFKSRGAGLGLSIAKGIVDMHGGQIWVESAGHDPEHCPGSTFYILLPVEPMYDSGISPYTVTPREGTAS